MDVRDLIGNRTLTPQEAYDITMGFISEIVYFSKFLAVWLAIITGIVIFLFIMEIKKQINTPLGIKEQNGSNKEDMIFKSKDKEMLRMKASGNWNEHKVPSKELKIKEQNGSAEK